MESKGGVPLLEQHSTRVQGGYKMAGELLYPVHQDHALFIVDLLQANFDDFGIAGLHGAADVLSLDGHFAMATVNEHAEGNALGTAKVKKAVHGGANGAAGVKNVVDKHQVHAVYAERDVRRLEDRLRCDVGEIVAIESDVQCADRHFHAVNAAHGLRNTL